MNETLHSRLPVVILISGTGSNMQRIVELSLANELPVEVRAVVSDHAEAKGLLTAARLGIATAHLNPKLFATRAEFDSALANLVVGYSPDLVILAGFMRILGAAFVQRFKGRMMNIHPSLLPKYRGLHTHQRVLQAGDKEHGASVHFVTEELDGGPVIIQARLPVLTNDTEAALAQRVLHYEHRIFPEAIAWYATGRLRCINGKALLDDQELTTPFQQTL